MANVPNNNIPVPDMFNTYIGARYVPVFAPGNSQWDNTNAYEPLTIVLYNGNSYTSKTFVPAGIDITNETYWACTGNFNGQVKALEDKMDNFQEGTDENSTDIENLQTQLQSLENTVNNNKYLQPLTKNKKYVLISDGILNASQLPSLAIQGTYTTYVIPNIGISNQNLFTGISADASVTDVIICCGLADSTQDITTPMQQAAANQAFTLFPNAQIHLCQCYYIFASNAQIASLNTYYQQMTSYGWQYIPAYLSVCYTGHWEKLSQTLVQSGITNLISFIKGNLYSFYRPMYNYLTPVIINPDYQLTTDTQDLNARIIIYDHMVEITLPTLELKQVGTGETLCTLTNWAGTDYGDTRELGIITNQTAINVARYTLESDGTHCLVNILSGLSASEKILNVFKVQFDRIIL